VATCSGSGNPGNWNTSFLNGFTQFDTTADNVFFFFFFSPLVHKNRPRVFGEKNRVVRIYFNNGSDSDSSFKYTRICARERNKKINDNNRPTNPYVGCICNKSIFYNRRST